MRGTGSPTDWFFLPVILITIGISAGARYRRFVIQWLSGIRGRDWPTLSASINLITVIPQTEQNESGERTIGYLATLTYFYRNPDLQVGDFSRMFSDEPTAQAWAESYKGRTVQAHVDPRDPTRSTLRKEDL